MRIKLITQKLGTVTDFKQLGAIVSNEGSKQNVLSRIARSIAALTKLKPVCKDNSTSLGSIAELMRSLVISVIISACLKIIDSNIEKTRKPLRGAMYRRLLKTSYKECELIKMFAERCKQILESITNS